MRSVACVGLTLSLSPAATAGFDVPPSCDSLVATATDAIASTGSIDAGLTSAREALRRRDLTTECKVRLTEGVEVLSLLPQTNPSSDELRVWTKLAWISDSTARAAVVSAARLHSLPPVGRGPWPQFPEGSDLPERLQQFVDHRLQMQMCTDDTPEGLGLVMLGGIVAGVTGAATPRTDTTYLQWSSSISYRFSDLVYGVLNRPAGAALTGHFFYLGEQMGDTPVQRVLESALTDGSALAATMPGARLPRRLDRLQELRAARDEGSYASFLLSIWNNELREASGLTESQAFEAPRWYSPTWTRRPVKGCWMVPS